MLEHPHLHPGLPVGTVCGGRDDRCLSGFDARHRSVLADSQHLLVRGAEGKGRIGGVRRFCVPGQSAGFVHIDRRCLPEGHLLHRLLNMHRGFRPDFPVHLADAGDFTFTLPDAGNSSPGIHRGNAFIGRRPCHALVVCSCRQHGCLQIGRPSGVHGQLRPVQQDFLRVLGHLDADVCPDIASVFGNGGNPGIAAGQAGDGTVGVHRRGFFIGGNPGNPPDRGVLRKEFRRQGYCFARRDALPGCGHGDTFHRLDHHRTVLHLRFRILRAGNRQQGAPRFQSCHLIAADLQDFRIPGSERNLLVLQGFRRHGYLHLAGFLYRDHQHRQFFLLRGSARQFRRHGRSPVVHLEFPGVDFQADCFIFLRRGGQADADQCQHQQRNQNFFHSHSLLCTSRPSSGLPQPSPSPGFSSVMSRPVSGSTPAGINPRAVFPSIVVSI